MNSPDTFAALAEPFEAGEVRFKPLKVSGNKALAFGYITARAVMDRLDEVLGGAGWQDDYEMLPDGSVVCRLRLNLDGEWVTKMDVGSPSEQPDVHDRLKAAFSDALKRAAVKFGIGRYLYRLPSQWADYDPQKRQFARKPSLPASALPTSRAVARTAPVPQQQVAAKPKPNIPNTGEELLDSVTKFEDAEYQKGTLGSANELTTELRLWASQKGIPVPIEDWGPAEIADASQFLRAYIESKRRQAG